MLSLPALLGTNLALVAMVMVGVWALSTRLRDVGIVDIAWGADGALIALITFLLTDGPLPRRLILTAMVTIWGVRLALYVGLRNRGKAEDFRYAAWRAEHGAAWPLRSLFTVFLFQASLIWAITIPVQLAQSSDGPSSLGLLEYFGLFLWFLGFLVEGVADRQLKTFLATPGSKGKVMDRGLWRYSRHPNYFGESLVWWGIFFVAAPVPWGWVTIFSPLLMTFFLLKVSGVPLLEEGLAQRREGYREYMKRTSMFIPWPPKEAG